MNHLKRLGRLAVVTVLVMLVASIFSTLAQETDAVTVTVNQIGRAHV